MRKIKGQSKLTKLITSKIGLFNRRIFSKMTADTAELKKLATLVNNDKYIDLHVVAFSSLKDYEEQILSILSFVKYVGQPASWIIYSDGSHTEREIEGIHEVFSFAKIIKKDIGENYLDINNVKLALQPFQKELLHFADNFVMGKKLFFYLNYPITKPTLFLDSDVLFYKKASMLKSILHQSTPGWYLPDATWGCLDSRYKDKVKEEVDQLNFGFTLINKELPDLSEGMMFLKELNSTYEYFSEQTIMHIISKSNNFKPLNSQDFVVDSGDQFDFAYLYTPKNLAIRHYTGPVRHKMWQKDWKWHLSIT